MGDFQKFNLEKAFAQLTKITEELSSDNLDLESAIVKFETGLELAKRIKKRLAEVETKMQTVKLKFKDTFAENGSES